MPQMSLTIRDPMLRRAAEFCLDVGGELSHEDYGARGERIWCRFPAPEFIDAGITLNGPAYITINHKSLEIPGARIYAERGEHILLNPEHGTYGFRGHYRAFTVAHLILDGREEYDISLE